MPLKDFVSIDMLSGEFVECLNRLDALLERACEKANTVYGAGKERFRGLYLDNAQVRRNLDNEPLSPAFPLDQLPFKSLCGKANDDSLLHQVKVTFGLCEFELDALLIALAPEFDLRYEKIYAFLQDDVTRKRPSIDLVLNLLAPSLNERLNRMKSFLNEAPLFGEGVLVAEDNARTPLLARNLIPDPLVVDFFLNRGFRACSEEQHALWILSKGGSEAGSAEPAFLAAKNAIKDDGNLHIHLYGASAIVRSDYAWSLAAYVQKPLHIVSVKSMQDERAEVAATVCSASLKSRLFDALLLIEEIGGPDNAEHSVSQKKIKAIINRNRGVIITAGGASWPSQSGTPYPIYQVEVPWPGYAQREEVWQKTLVNVGIALRSEEIESLSSRFQLSLSGIVHSVQLACLEARNSCDSDHIVPDFHDLSSAVRKQNGQVLTSLANRVTPGYSWSDIILPEETLLQLSEICLRLEHKKRVFDTWGFGDRLSTGKGVNALFSGPSGTGKTMAAEVIANELGLDLYRIDLSGIVSKYIGETEKNLDRVFNAARNANAILFFDEADALFGKRSEVKDAHDRYANIEVSYLLQKMEEYEGLAILATNLRQNMDEAFLRRLAFLVHFPFPDEQYRLAIWQAIWPTETPLSSDLDLFKIARTYKLSGGNIKNVALAAAFFAAEDRGEVNMHHLFKALQREFQKMGRTIGNDAYAELITTHGDGL